MMFRWMSGVAAAAIAAILPVSAQAQAADAEEIVVTGSRTSGRTAIASPEPIDLIGGETLRAAGGVADELGQSLAVLAPAFNFPRQSNSGTSDHVRAGQLRGLAPDQLLVLVNGRRRHISAVVNTETKIGRGAAAVDFNAIPLSAVKRVEILRDGAGAQYGSDAIAGVINVILDDAPTGGSANLGFGLHVTHPDALDLDIQDGETFTADASYGFAVGAEGFFRFGVDYENRRGTNRAGFDQIPFFENQTPPNLALQGLRNYVEGDPGTGDVNLWYNSEASFRGATLYGFGTLGYRETSGGLFFRYPDSSNNVAAIYSGGFLPRSTGENLDFAGASGVRFAALGFDFDASLGTARNEFVYGVRNSLNASLGPLSPRSFESGTFRFEQVTVNIDAARELDVAGIASRLALGAEYRNEGFESEAGDPASFAAGPLTAPIGAQGAPGVTPADIADISRDVFAIYGEWGADLTDALFVSAAGRYEDYSDFGDALTGKVSALYQVAPGVGLRGSVSNSVRAPSLPQKGFSDRSFNFGDNRVPIITLTARDGSAIARALGARPLEEERSTSATLGVTWRPIEPIRITIDAFRVDIDDRITLSERFFGDALAAFVQGLPGGTGVQSVRFFANAVDTKTEGVDVVADYGLDLLDGRLTLGLAYTYSQTGIEAFAQTPAALRAIDPSFRLVGVEEINTIEEAAPRTKTVLSADWKNDRVALLARVSLFGGTARVFNFGGGFEPRQSYSSEAQLDLEGAFNFTDRVRFTVGASNLLDEYPDESSSDINYFGNLPYDILSPVGVNGRYLYSRLSVTY